MQGSLKMLDMFMMVKLVWGEAGNKSLSHGQHSSGAGVQRPPGKITVMRWFTSQAGKLAYRSGSGSGSVENTARHRPSSDECPALSLKNPLLHKG